MTWKEEVERETAKLAVSIRTKRETFNNAQKRARNLFRIVQQRETDAMLTLLRHVPVCKSEAYDPDMYGFGGYEEETQLIEEDEEEI